MMTTTMTITTTLRREGGDEPRLLKVNRVGISIAICEKDAPSAPCAGLKKRITKLLVSDVSPFGDAAEYDLVVPLDDAKGLFEDYDAFMKRNRINAETDVIYMEKVKKAEDLALLEPKAVKRHTGWVVASMLDDAGMDEALNLSKPENRMTAWDELDFDEGAAMCVSCPLSWDKGRGCIGAYGPDSSQLPEIASRRGCPIIASAPEGAKSGRMYTPEEAEQMAKEALVLEEALPEEGKMAVRRYSGPVERLKAVADISIREGCGFYFF